MLKAIVIAALVLGVAAVTTGCTASYRAKQAEAAFPPSGQFVEVDGRRVHYVQQGSGPDVILLHGAGGNLRDYTFALIDQLSDRYRVTAFDRPGLGYSDRVPEVETGPFATEGDSPMDQADMLRKAAMQLGVENPVVVGHSFGGIVAYAWANMGLEQDSPVNAAAMVSFAGVAMPWPGGLGAYYTVNGSVFGGLVTIPLIAAFVPPGVVEDAISGTFAPQDAPDGYADHIGAPLTLRPDAFRANVRQVNTLRPHVVEMEKAYPDLTLPIEILHGTADETVPIAVHSERIAGIVPSANLTRLDGVGHMPHHVDQDAAVAAIDRAVARAGLR
ncbi:MAG: alpha/beta hydrolase [Paracoccaceae bacterium]